MRSLGGWIVAVLAIPFIGADAVLAWSLLTTYDLVNHPQAGVLITIGLLSAGLAALGVFGAVEFGRRGSIKWLVTTILSTLIGWAALVSMVVSTPY